MASRPKKSLESVSIGKETPVVPHKTVGETKKSLTLKLNDSDYERLRRYAFETKQSHQAVIEAAVLSKLDAVKV